MFDILVYLFENYFDAGGYPDPDTLARKLSAAGFEQGEIDQALDWLNGLEQQGAARYVGHLAESRASRCYSAVETAKINVQGQGFLAFLEQAGVLNPLQRELIIDRVLAFEDEPVSLDKIKLAVLMVLWSQKQALDSLILEELLTADRPSYYH